VMVPTPDDGETLNKVDRNANVYLDDADAVEKTTYVGDRHGADVGHDAQDTVPVTAPVDRPKGLGPIGWIALVLAALAFAIYASGLFR
jgi:hypothetical protein